jgi:hypothetical protein
VHGVNLIIYGEKFDIICFISEDEIASTVNCIYAYIMRKPLFEERFYGTYVLMPFKAFESQPSFVKIKQWFNHNLQDYHETVHLCEKRRP